MSDFPADDVLVARGKYSTLSSERRSLMRALREDMEAVANYARYILRTEDLEFCTEQAQTARSRIDQALARLERLRTLAGQLEELRPAAWGKKEPE